MIFSRTETTERNTGEIVDRLVETIAAVGTAEFDEHLRALMQESLGVSAFLVFRCRAPGRTPELLFPASGEKLTVRWARTCCEGLLTGHAVFEAASPVGKADPINLRIRADDLRDLSLRRACFAPPRRGSECLTLAQQSASGLIGISAFIVKTSGGSEAQQASEFDELARLLLPVLALHARLSPPPGQPEVGAAMMEDRVSGAFPELTGREVAVCARSILGVTAEGIALDLGIAQTSVLTYRRRAYARLNINSINQLSAMLIQSSGAAQSVAA